MSSRSAEGSARSNAAPSVGGAMFALPTLALAPTLIRFPVSRKRLVASLATTGTKG
ncbi:hypothetical protein ABT288_47790 [Streptomyces sp. NPDC001093]|uniref:hypothetical protein n=1 Tax=Streptomyces sp. NPDC001093 TaxID=3154376 RepID=UPI003318FB76